MGRKSLVAPTDPGLCEDDSTTRYVSQAFNPLRTRFLSALPLASLALEDGGSALPNAEPPVLLSLRAEPAVVPPLPVELNRDRRHEIRVTERYETDGPFQVDLDNYGDGVHVHVNVAGDLAAVARVEESNPYVEAETTATVRVDVDPVDEPVTGELVLVTGYGGEETRVAVSVEPFEGPSRVPVGEDLATPDPDRAGTTRAAAETADGGGVPVQVLIVATGASLIALAVAVVVRGPVLVAGAGLVVLACLAAVGLSLR